MIEDNEFTFEDLVGQASDQAASIPDSLSFEQLVGEQAIEPTLEDVEQLKYVVKALEIDNAKK